MRELLEMDKEAKIKWLAERFYIEDLNSELVDFKEQVVYWHRIAEVAISCFEQLKEER